MKKQRVNFFITLAKILIIPCLPSIVRLKKYGHNLSNIEKIGWKVYLKSTYDGIILT